MYKKRIFIFFVLILVSFFKGDGYCSNFDIISSASLKKHTKKDHQELLGIKIESIKLTAYGKLIDIRYRVIDRKKASLVFSPKTHPSLVDRETGKKLYVPNTPKVGSLRSFGTAIEGKVYFMLFNNSVPLKRGSKVDLVIGDVIIEDLVIE